MAIKEKSPSKRRERRRHPRVHIRQQIVCRDQDHLRHLYATNLSKGGMFIETPSPPPIGTLMRVALKLPDTNRYIELTGKVVQHHPFGAGLQFLNMTANDIQSIESFITEQEDQGELEPLIQGELVHPSSDRNLWLSGSLELDHCSLATLLCYLKEKQHSGMLRISSGSDFHTILLDKGHPVEISSSKFNENYCLGRILKRIGSISNDDLQASLKQMIKTGSRQGTILVQNGLLSPEDLQRGLELQLEIKLDEVLNWHTGSFQFYPKEVVSVDAETAAPPYIDLQQTIFRSVYRHARKRAEMTLQLFCNFEDFHVVPTFRELRTKNNRKLFTGEVEVQIWHHIMHLNACVKELCHNKEFDHGDVEAFLFGLLSAGLVSLENGAPSADRDQNGHLHHLLHSGNLFQRLNLPWTAANLEAMEKARQRMLTMIGNINGELSAQDKRRLKQNLEEAYQTLSNEQQRRRYRKALVEDADRHHMASRLYRLGTVKLNQGEHSSAYQLLQAAADLSPKNVKIGTWLKKAKSQVHE